MSRKGIKIEKSSGPERGLENMNRQRLGRRGGSWGESRRRERLGWGERKGNRWNVCRDGDVGRAGGFLALKELEPSGQVA